MNEGQCKDFNMFIKHNFFKNNKKSISKGLLKIRFNFDPSKVHNYHLVKVLNKSISHLILLFHYSRQLNHSKHFGMGFDMNSLIY
jgi:hypothetical protein